MEEVLTCGGADGNATVFRCSGDQVLGCSGVRVFRCSGVQVRKIQYGLVGKTQPLTSPRGATHPLTGLYSNKKQPHRGDTTALVKLPRLSQPNFAVTCEAELFIGYEPLYHINAIRAFNPL